MADVEAKSVSTTEKKVAEEEATKEVAKDTKPEDNVSPVKNAEKIETEAEEVTNDDEDSKASENGKSEDAKENGSSEEKEVDEKETESTNGDSTDAPTDNVCCIKRKSTGGEVTDDAAKDVVSPKKAKIDEDLPATKVGANGQV
ncbi:uncharacterized protein LOC131667100 [Phymastichus coffea]|uniref:uncharacterized protein LOC131667100 n=1 Tax=Phymastichus coffea TaxID=108790 RepID=UPI00273C1D9D|nr:uncharacterized protein LOC131667100 [Phymastichus coffea]